MIENHLNQCSNYEDSAQVWRQHCVVEIQEHRCLLQILVPGHREFGQSVRGYMVREINEQEIRDAIDVRGVLEGLAAQLLAERGVSRGVQAVLRDCLDKGDALFETGMSKEDDLEIFHDFNMRFHETIIIESGNTAIADALAGNDHLPFASTSSLAFDFEQVEAENKRFNLAHMQHHLIVDALCNGQSTRAGSLMTEHAHAAINYADIFGQGANASDKARLFTAA